MAALTIAHTAQLDALVLDEAHALCVCAFGERFDDDDWDHALGGLHALIREGDRLVAHGAAVQRQLLHGGRTLRAGYVEAVAVHPAHRRRGHASAVMAALEDALRRAYDLGALAASPDGARLYQVRGWTRWRGPTAALTPDGVRSTPEEDGTVWVLPAAADLDPDSPLICDWRAGDLW